MEREKVLIQQRQKYGETVFYPYNDTAKKLAQLARTKTLTPNAIHVIKELGYEVISDRMDFPQQEQK